MYVVDYGGGIIRWSNATVEYAMSRNKGGMLYWMESLTTMDKYSPDTWIGSYRTMFF